MSMNRITPAAPRLALSSLLILPIALFVVACGGATTPDPVEVTPSGPMSLALVVSPDAPIVMHIDVDGIRQSPYYQIARDMIPPDQEADVAQFLSVLDKTDHVRIALFAEERGILAARGNYAPADFDLLMNMMGAPTTTFPHREHTTRGDDGARAVLVGEDTFLLGTTNEVHGAIDRLDGVASARGSSLAGFSQAAQRVRLGEADISAVVLFTPEVRGIFRGSGAEQELAQNGVAAGFGLGMRDGVQLEAFFEASSEGAVRAVAAEVTRQLDAIRSDVMLGAMGISALLEHLQLRENGTTLEVEFRLDDAEVRRTIERFQPIVQGMAGAI